MGGSGGDWGRRGGVVLSRRRPKQVQHAWLAVERLAEIADIGRGLGLLQPALERHGGVIPLPTGIR